jgi:putative ABC transport system permease protein
MIVFAGAASGRRAKDVPGVFGVSPRAIACGAGSVIALMTGLGVIDKALTSPVPVGSMLIANAYVQAFFEASLIPAMDSLRSLGIVWIPALMAGMLLSGARPVYAAIYQFVVLAMIFAAWSLTSLISKLLIRGRIFSSAQRLQLQPRRSPV